MVTDRYTVLRMAYAWTCDDCGRDSFANTIVADLPEYERREAAVALGADPDDEGAIVMMPDEVTCVHCGAVFKTQDDRLENV